MRTPICDRFGIEFPIFAFSHCRDVVAAVSKAGGMGVLGALYFTPEELEIELNWIDEHVDGRPYGVDLVMPATLLEEARGADSDPAELERQLEAMIPQANRDFVEKVLAEHDIAPLPEDGEPAPPARLDRHHRARADGRRARAPGVAARERAGPAAGGGRADRARARASRWPRSRAPRATR